jgi:hypothetical protein
MSRQVVSYSHLPNEKPQIAATTFQNTIDMLNDLKERGGVCNNNSNMIVFVMAVQVNTNVEQHCTC